MNSILLGSNPLALPYYLIRYQNPRLRRGQIQAWFNWEVEVQLYGIEVDHKAKNPGTNGILHLPDHGELKILGRTVTSSDSARVKFLKSIDHGGDRGLKAISFLERVAAWDYFLVGESMDFPTLRCYPVAASWLCELVKTGELKKAGLPPQDFLKTIIQVNSPAEIPWEERTITGIC